MRCGGRRSGLLTALLVGSQLAMIPSLDVQESQVDTAQVHCPQCGWQIQGDFAWCPNCGTRTKPYRCEYCQGFVPTDAESCVHCGAPVN